MKAIMISIKSQWVEKILNGEKTIEILEPTNIVIVGEIPKEIQKDDRIINFDSYLTILQKKKRSV